MVVQGMIKIFSFLLVIFLTYGCGGGSGGGSDTDADADGGHNSEELNPGLTGYLLFERDDSAYLLDAELGTFSQVPNTYWDRYDDIFDMPESSRFSIRPVFNDHTEYVIKARNCYHSFGDILTCIVIQDYEGIFHEQFSTWDTIHSPTLSPDKKYIALFRELAEDWLEIYTRSGELISSSRAEDTNLSWLSNGRIIFIDRRRFVFTYINSTEAEFYLELPNNIDQDAVIGIFSVSPDEQKIVFQLATSSYSKPYIMNIDGSDIRQLADLPSDSAYKDIYEPQWSPDGKWIMLKTGVSAVSGGQQGTLQNMYLVPSEDLGKVFILSTVSSKRSEEVREFYRYEKIDNTGSITNKALAETSMYWIP
jgi:hypothetical protein